LTSKIHLAVDGRGLPMSVILTPGQAGDNPQLLPLLDQIAVHRDGPGRARKLPERVSADKTCSRPSTRAALRSRGAPVGCAERGPQPGASLPSGRLNQGGNPPEPRGGRDVVVHGGLRGGGEAVAVGGGCSGIQPSRLIRVSRCPPRVRVR
jgi:hypothetical protein